MCSRCAGIIAIGTIATGTTAIGTIAIGIIATGTIGTGTTGTGTIAVGATEPLGGIARSGACAHSGGSFRFGSTGLLGYAGVAL
jgi:hypothetical protein